MPIDWRNPRVVETVAGALAVVALYVYSLLDATAPPWQTITLVLLWVFVPTFASNYAARWWQSRHTRDRR